MSIEIKVPTLGESVTEATIARWLKNEGDVVKRDEPVVELETDKVNVEVPSPAAGVLEHIEVKAGGTVNVGAVLGAVKEGAAAASAAKASPPQRRKRNPQPNLRKRHPPRPLLQFRRHRPRCGASRKRTISTCRRSRDRASAVR